MRNVIRQGSRGSVTFSDMPAGSRTGYRCPGGVMPRSRCGFSSRIASSVVSANSAIRSSPVLPSTTTLSRGNGSTSSGSSKP